MPHFIKTGFWEKAQKGALGWLNLEKLIADISISFANITGNPSDNTNLAADLDAKVDNNNTAVALVDPASMALTSTKQTLTSASATRSFTISYLGDEITLEVILNTTSATYTFPATTLCVSEGTASGDNILALAGVSGDKYIICIKKIGSNYYVVAKNFKQ